MNKEHRPILSAIALCILFFVGYNYYINNKYPDLKKDRSSASKDGATQVQSPQATDAPASPPSAVGTAESPSTSESSVVKIPDQDLLFETDVMAVTFNQDQASPASIILKKYRQSYEKEAPALDIAPRGLNIQAGPDSGALYEITTGYAAAREGDSLRFERNFGAFRVAQTFKFPKEGYLVDYVVELTNQNTQPEKLDLRLTMRQPLVYPIEKKAFIPIPGSGSHRPMFVAVANETSDYYDIKKACGDAKFFPTPPVAEGSNSSVEVVGFDTHYFLNALLPNSATPFNYKMAVYAAPSDEESCPVALVLTQALGNIAAGETSTHSFKLYFGPKDNNVMTSTNAEGLSKSINFGFFSIIAVPLLKGLEFFYKHTGNWGIAIIIVTILLKFLFYPLQKQASISAHHMKKLQPQMTKIRERYKDDPRKQQQELMRFMSTNKINPMKGCIPILPTIPVFFAFFQVLSSAIELRHSPFFGWIYDLSEPDPFYVTPILLTVAMFVQQKMTPMTGMDKNQQKIMAFLPIIFGVMMLTLPAGMTIYMFTNTVVQMGQMKWIQRKLDLMDEKKSVKELAKETKGDLN